MMVFSGMRGAFITFEGLDGCGKTTQLERLAHRLRKEGFKVTMAREPGGTKVGDSIRRILLASTTAKLEPAAELMLYFASRAQNVSEVILPSLRAGHVVLCDRFTDASMAYQGHGRGLGAEAVEHLDQLACRGLKPHHTILIDIDPTTSVARARQRNKSAARDEGRLERESLEFFRRVRRAYLDIAFREPQRVHVVNGERSPDSVHQEIWDLVASWGIRKQ